MKLATSNDQITEKSGITQVNSFAIEASAKAFTILSDTLYSDKIRAVVRELSTNAYDAHVDVNSKDRPFEVNLPNRYDSNFSIRDYGPGLSHEDCMGLYTTYFRSTKTNSNESIGCLGLGSKSPFAYSDTFTVESIFEGKKRIYVANKGSCSPEFNLLHEEDCIEETGLCVKVPVKQNDYSTFLMKAKSLYSYFVVKPISNTSMDYYNHKDDCQFSDGNWYISESLGSNYVVMGQVAYPIRSDKFKEKYSEIESFLNKVSGIVIQAPIGSVEMTPSREELSYNVATVNYIVDSLSLLIENLLEKVVEQIEGCPDIHSARLKYMDISISYKPKNMTYKGEVMFQGNVNTVKIDPIYEGRISRYVGNKNLMYDTKIFGYSPTDLFVLDASVSYKKERFNSINKEYKQDLIIFSGTKEEFMVFIGTTNPDLIIDLATLPYISRTRNTGGSIPCQVYDKVTETFINSVMSVKYENAYYISESRGYICIEGYKYNHRTFAFLIKELSSLGFEIDGDLYTVKPSQIKTSNLDIRKNWTSFRDVFRVFVAKVLEENKDTFSKAYNNISTDHSQVMKAFSKYSIVPKATTLYDEYTKAFDDQKNAINEIARFTQKKYFKRYIEHIYESIPSWKFSQRIKDIINDYYPMLGTSLYITMGDKENSYIEDMDELRIVRKKISQNSCVSV